MQVKLQKNYFSSVFMSKKEVKDGYMDSVLSTLRVGEQRSFALDSENVKSWRSVASRANKRVGYKRYSVLASKKLKIMVVMCNAEGC